MLQFLTRLKSFQAFEHEIEFQEIEIRIFQEIEIIDKID
jgi:hypothetical protein